MSNIVAVSATWKRLADFSLDPRQSLYESSLVRGPGQLPFAKVEELLQGGRISHCLEPGLNGDYQKRLAVLKE